MAFIYDDPALTYDDAGTTYEGLPFIFDDVTVAVEFGFGYQPLATTVVWQPATSYVREISVDRGRSSEFSSYGPGTCTLTVDNRDRRFDPEHTTGPFYGDLLPMVPMRVTTSYGGTDYTLFYGFVTGWPTAYNQSNSDAVSTITAVDGNRLLGNTTLNPAFYNTVITEPSFSLYYPLQEWVQVPYVFGGSPTQLIGSYPTSGGKPLQIGGLRDEDGFAPIEQDQIFTSGSGPTGIGIREQTSLSGEEFTTSAIRTVEFFVGRNEISATLTALNLICDGTATGTILFIDLSMNTSGQISDLLYRNYADGIEVNPGSPTAFDVVDDENVASHVIITNDTSEVRFYVNGVLARTEPKTSTISPSGSGNGTITQLRLSSQLYWSNIAFYEDTFTLTDAERHYAATRGFVGDLTDERLDRVLDAAGWPSAWRDLDTGVQTVDALLEGNTLDRVRQVGDAEQGAVFVNRDGGVRFINRTATDVVSPVALFDDDGTDFPFSNVQVDSNTIDAIRNRIEARFRTGTVVVSDAASVAAYGESSQSLDLSLINTQATAESIAEARLAATKDPRTRVRRLDVNVRADTSMVPTVAALELADDVTVSFTPTGVGDELWRAVRVQGLSHTITLERWDTQLYLAPGPINVNGPLMLLDDDEYGKLSSGNKLG